MGRTPLTEITRSDIAALIKQDKRRAGSKFVAFHRLSLISGIFSWALGQECYGITENPVRHLNRAKLIGTAPLRTRVLTDDEIRALWKAADSLGTVALYKMLLLTGARVGSICGGQWKEIDKATQTWTIPAERMKKTRNGEAAFTLPITPDMQAVLYDLLRFEGSPFMFTAVTNQDQRRCRREWVEKGRGRIGHNQHVAFLNLLETADR